MKRFRFVSALFLGCAAMVCSALATDIQTNRGDNARTGLNANETKTSLLLSGESPVSSDDVGCGDLRPEIGITATPVIDRSAGPNGTIFVVVMSKNATNFFIAFTPSIYRPDKIGSLQQ